MMSKQAVATMILSLTLGAVSFPRAAAGQLPSASTATLATANNYTALARGFTAIASNPAGLAMPGNPGFSLALLPVQARVGLNAIRLDEIDALSGQTIPVSTKVPNRLDPKGLASYGADLPPREVGSTQLETLGATVPSAREQEALRRSGARGTTEKFIHRGFLQRVGKLSLPQVEP